MRDEERVERWGADDRREQKWDGWPVFRDVWMRQRTLYWIIWHIVSQWSYFRIGILWCNSGTTARAAELRANWLEQEPMMRIKKLAGMTWPTVHFSVKCQSSRDKSLGEHTRSVRFCQRWIEVYCTSSSSKCHLCTPRRGLRGHPYDWVSTLSSDHSTYNCKSSAKRCGNRLWRSMIRSRSGVQEEGYWSYDQTLTGERERFGITKDRFHKTANQTNEAPHRPYRRSVEFVWVT